MFNAAARAVAASRPVAAAAAATVAANAAQGTAQARAPPPQAASRTTCLPHAGPSAKIVDRDEEWLLAELQDDRVLFRPYSDKEVDEAANEVLALWSGQGYSSASRVPCVTVTPTVTEPEDDEEADTRDSRSSTSSDGRSANAVIEGTNTAYGGVTNAAEPELASLMAITTRLLRRPGMQREVFKGMLEDAEIRTLMLRECNDLDRYLHAAGVINPGLLPAPEQPAALPSTDQQGAEQGPSLVSKLRMVVAGALERTGEALASLGNWLRRNLALLFSSPHEEAEEGAGEPRQQRTADQVLGGVMVLAVAVVCMALIRRPLVLRAVRA